MNSRESNIEIAKVSFDKDSAAEEPTVGTSSEVLIDKQPQTATDPQQALQEYKAALPQPVDPTVLSPSTSIASTSLTSEALTSSSTKQHPPRRSWLIFMVYLRLRKDELAYLMKHLSNIHI
ncbi:uncharacterized protein LOC114761509 [Neltuma alba]|uniref:uncharacterized protein LOC114761509 n=1 Tax=Neltuma alba TaxID=207710 RepID=UPI0010A558A7|nr:uncharacterized protein LOC114761509 [Prosopis alba]